MSPRTRHAAIVLSLALAACTPSQTSVEDAAALRDAQPLPQPIAGPVPAESAPPPTFLPRQTLRPGQRDATRAPVSLTASDGTGLKLVSMRARAVVEEPLAFTELQLVFENPTDRQIEGRFEVEMPPNAAISRFAMLVGERWQEGEVVERRAAQRAYEDFLHRKQDPALLENSAGNAFSARVFPIGPRERKQLIVAYSQELANSGEPYRLLLRGLPELDELDASVILHEPAAPAVGLKTSLATTAGARRIIELKRHKWTPDQDLEVLDERGFAIMGLRRDNLAVARVAAVGATAAAPIGGLVVLLDTSASRALGFAAQIQRLHELLQALSRDEDFNLALMSFDQTVHQVYSGPVRGLRLETLNAALLERGALGASDLAGALGYARKALWPGRASRLLIVSDGITTAGDPEINSLQQAARGLADRGIERIDAIVDGGIQDAEILRQIAGAGLPQRGVVVDARLTPATIVHKLTSTVLADFKVMVPGAAWTWPDTLRGLQPGDEALVYADLPESAAMRVILTGDDKIDVTVPTTSVERPLLERAWVGARIERLDAMRSALPPGDRDGRVALQRQVVELSTRFRVLSDFTALLVLETEADYARFGIDRNALSDILTVDAGGLSLQQRRAPSTSRLGLFGQGGALADEAAPDRGDQSDLAGREAATPQPAPQPDAAPTVDGKLDDDLLGKDSGAGDLSGLGLKGTGRGGGGTGEGTIGLGNTGLIGRGGGGGTGSGYGRGAGAGFGGRGSRIPTVRMARVEVRGALHPDIIRRVVRANINVVRHCYNHRLVHDPSLAGRVTIKFTIDLEGKVPSAVVQESTLRDPAVGSCIAAAIQRWRFPKPDGGIVLVNYPFVLEPGDGTVEPMERPSRRRPVEEDEEDEPFKRPKVSPYTGAMKDIMQLLAHGDTAAALTKARAWRARDPGDVLALVALGEALEAAKQPEEAARAYGSIIDLFPSRADLRRHAGTRLERLPTGGLELAVDTYAKAVAQRPDHPASHRLYAYALARAGRHAEALAAMIAGLAKDPVWSRFPGVDRIFREDIAILAAVRIAADPLAEKAVLAELAALGIPVATEPSLRFVLNWETDANDVDFHIVDGRGHRAWYEQQELASGGELFADITSGYGPECFAIPGKPRAFPYTLSAHYYARGPMGYGMGALAILQHDGKGALRFEERPFVIMQDDAFVELGRVRGPLE